MNTNAQPKSRSMVLQRQKNTLFEFKPVSLNLRTVYAMVLKTYNKLAIKHCPGNKTFLDQAQQSLRLLPSLYVSKKREEEKAPILVVAAQ